MKVSRVEIAAEAFARGYSCSQSVLYVYSEDYGIARSDGLRLSSCFGGGMRMGATCGALSGALMILGLARGHHNPDASEKAATEELCKSFVAAWTGELGQTDCREILGIDPSDPVQRQRAREEGVFDDRCPACVKTAVRLLEQFLANADEETRI